MFCIATTPGSFALPQLMVSRQPPPPSNNPKHSIANIDVRRFQFGNRLIYTYIDAAGGFLTAEFFRPFGPGRAVSPRKNHNNENQTMALSRFVNCCVCGNNECFSLQTQMFQQQILHTTTTTITTPAPTTAAACSSSSTLSSNPWCQPSPYCISFVPQNANYNTWLFVLCVYHHIPNFRQQFLDFVENIENEPGGGTKRQRWYINRHQIPTVTTGISRVKKYPKCGIAES